MVRFLKVAFGLLVILALNLTTTLAVENTWDPSVQVSATVQSSPASITLSWPQDTNGVPSSYTVFRRSPTSSDWGGGTTIAGSSTSYVDSNVTRGTAYEYRIVKAASTYTGYGYITAGVEATLVDSRGTVVLVVDNTMASTLASELSRLDADLRGDGWNVVRRDVSRTDSPTSVKAFIKSVYNADPANVKSVFLFGHVPVPYSGQLNPDGHPDHVGAWPADVYYGDMDGSWTDNSVNYVQTVNTDPADAARLTNVPGDGKFDQTTIPATVKLAVGRVDLSNMPGRVTWGGPASFPSETELLRKYLNKDHNFRHRITNPARRAILGDYFGYRGGEAFAASGFRSFAPMVGASNIRNLNTEFNDQRGVWIPQAAASDYLLAYGCGAGSYNTMSGLGNTLAYNGASTTEMVINNVRGVFNLLFGSWLGDWDHEDDFLRSPLVTDYGLTAVWSGRPHWFMHPMGLGATIGDVTRLTQNNSGQYQTIINSSQNQIHIALMGDPTLRLHPVVPVSNLNGSTSGSTAALSWSGSSDSGVVGYHVYRASSATGSYTRLTSSPISATTYTDSGSSSGATYMVRAVKLENAASGSYYNASQGVFWTVGGSSSGSTTPPPAPAVDSTAPTISISAPAISATLSGTVTVTANATDNVAVVGVQFKLDGANLGSEVTSAPFNATLNTTTVADGAHTLSAVARDAAGNMASANPVSVSVLNTTVSATVPSSGGGTSSGGSTTSSGGTTTNTPPAGSVPAILAASGTTVWIDDDLPAGAGGISANGGDAWTWVTSPAPFSGAKAHQSATVAGQHEHWFGWSNNNLAISTGDILFTYIYLDPANLPSEIMLSWSTSSSWEHRAYWGANRIDRGTNASASRYYMGPIPAAGQWVRLEVPASAVGLEGQSVTAMNFSLVDGGATWDASGKALPKTSSSSSTTTTTGGTTSSTPVSSGGTETIWFDDALPPGAGGTGANGDTWNWVSNPAPVSGTLAHQSAAMAGEHSHWFGWSNQNMAVATGDKLFVYVYLDPANLPSELMIMWSTNSSWEHRAYWGANKIGVGTDGTAGRYYAGPLPAAGQWVRLEVPASAVGLEGDSATAMNFMLCDGRATFDKTGKLTGSTTTTNSSSTGSTTTTPPAPTLVDTIWFDDALPPGAGGTGGNGDTWNWVSNPAPVSGTLAHQSAAMAGEHSHWFGWSNQNMAVATGDKLFVYVYLDPANLPSELMIMWSTNSSWEHRAYWGANKIGIGTDGTAGRYYAGPLPAAGQWVRLEVPASAVGLEGDSATAMNFMLCDGRATFDKTGKASAATSSTTSSSSGTTTTTTTTPSTTPSGGTSSGTTTITTSPAIATTPTSTTTPASATMITVVSDNVWFDDALPLGVTGSATGGDSWLWVASNPAPFSGTVAHQSNIKNSLHEHSFNFASQPLAVATGDKMFVYVYLDPANVPAELMVSWCSDSWEHRAYWGADKINYGKKGTPGHYYAGALPAVGQWVRLEVPASAVGLEGQSVQGMTFSLYQGRATWDKTGTATTITVPSIGGVASSGGTSSGGTSSGGTSSGGTTSGGTSSGGTSSGGTSSGGTTTTTPPAAIAENSVFALPAVGSNELRVLSPTVLELRRITTKPIDGAVDTWNFVDSSGNLNAPATSAFTVKVGGSTVSVSSVAFRRRALYAPLEVRDLRIDNCLYLTLSTPVTEGASVEVTNPSGALWPSSMQFTATASALRGSPAIHVNQEGYTTNLPKKAMIGYYLGNGGELTVDASVGFKLVTASTGVTVYSGTLTARADVGYDYTPLPYQKVLQADFSAYTTPGEYQIVVPGVGASLPFLIDDGIAMGFARTYALGIYHQRCGASNALPFTRFVHDACHVGAAQIPSLTDSSFDFTWNCIAQKSSENPNPSQTAPQLTKTTMLYPFVNQGTVDVSGGHHDAGDYSKYTHDVALLVHNLMFTVDAIPGAAALDNLGLPESGDGISDILQEAKHEASFLAKMQDADGGFYFLVYPKTREYEDSLPDNSSQQVVWPKTTAVTAESVAALAQTASSPQFKAAYPAEAAAYLAKAKLGWQFLMNAIAKYGKDGAYQKITHYGDRWMHNDELAWAACELFLATGEAQYSQKLMEWFPNPADPATFRDSWGRLAESWGCAIRSYAFAARSGRVAASQLNATYLAACENQIKLAGDDMLRWSKENAYGTAFPDYTKRYQTSGWYFSLDQAADMAAAYQLDPKPDYIDSIVTNMNYEAGTNPVNVSYLAGVGLKRQQQMVNQYAEHDPRKLPPTGIPAGNISADFGWGLQYYRDGELASLSFPTDTKGAAMMTPFYDRFTDVWCVYNEFVTVNQARALTSVAFLATQTSAKSAAWKPTTTAKIVVSAATLTVGQPITLSLDATGLDLTNARITWEARDSQPDYGSTFIVTPKSTGAYWAEAEIVWPDGRRVFATGAFNVQ